MVGDRGDRRLAMGQNRRGRRGARVLALLRGVLARPLPRRTRHGTDPRQRSRPERVRIGVDPYDKTAAALLDERRQPLDKGGGRAARPRAVRRNRYLTAFLSCEPGVKRGTLAAAILIFSPVRGLMP
ncbi:hypothetical protein HRbin41_01188 [bacterium HR41]|nr:hypothetical protein HRbin41_01188 [bacterium HR41]